MNTEKKEVLIIRVFSSFDFEDGALSVESEIEYPSGLRPFVEEISKRFKESDITKLVSEKIAEDFEKRLTNKI